MKNIHRHCRCAARLLFFSCCKNIDAPKVNPAIAISNEALKDGHLSIGEANEIWRANTDPNFELTVDASKLTVKQLESFKLGAAKGVVEGADDWLVHGSNKLQMNADGTIAMSAGKYDFTPNPREWHSSWIGYATRNVETYLGFYAASQGGFNVGVDFNINYSGTPRITK